MAVRAGRSSGAASRSRRLRAALRRFQQTRRRELLMPAALVTGALLALLVTAIAWPLLRRIVLLGSTSVLLAYLIAPLVETIRRRVLLGSERRPLSRAAALLVLYALFAAGGLATWRLVAPRFERQATNLSAEAHRTVHLTLARVRALEPEALRVGPPAAGSRLASLTVTLADQAELHADAVLGEVAEHTPFLPWLGLAPVLAFFLIKDVKAFRTSAIRVIPEGHLRWRAEEFFRHVNSVLAGYARAQLLSCLVIAVLCTAGFAVLRVPYPLALGALAGVLEFLPVVGPLATALVAASLVSGTRLLLLGAFLVALRLAQDYVIYPRLTGTRMHLHPVAIVVGVLLGAKFGGLVGVFCAVPLVGIGAVTLRHYREYRDIQALIAQHERELATLAPPPEGADVAGPDATGVPDRLPMGGS